MPTVPTLYHSLPAPKPLVAQKVARGFCLVRLRILIALAVRHIRQLVLLFWWALFFGLDLQRSGSRQSVFLLVVRTARSAQLTRDCTPGIVHYTGWDGRLHPVAVHPGQIIHHCKKYCKVPKCIQFRSPENRPTTSALKY